MIKVGDRMSIPEENIAGVVTDVFFDGADAEPYAVVLELSDGQFATIDMSKVTERVLH